VNTFKKVKRSHVPVANRRLQAKVLKTPSQPIVEHGSMPVIPGYTGAEIGKIVVSGQSKQKNLLDPISMVDMVAHICHPTYGKERKIGQSQCRLAWAKSKTLSSK
jgi:hypothetical protein